MTGPTCAQPAALFERLKLKTQPWHEQLEKDLDLLRPDFTRRQYSDLLARFYGFYQPWETAQEPQVRNRIPALLERCHKASLLRDDLNFLGWTDNEISGIPLFPAVPVASSQSAMLGAFYVMEGATLGGQILERHFTPKLHLEQGGCRFFRGYGAETGSKWKEFRKLAESYSWPEDYDSIVASACETFANMQSWLSRADLCKTI